MITNIYFPWGAGLGTLAFRFSDHYTNYTIQNSSVQKYVARYATFDHSHITERSWYRLTRAGWQLFKREDRWGEWKNGVRRPPLYEQPSAGIPQRAWELRAYFKPYQKIDWYGQQLEVISYPCPEKDRVTLMVREPDDPTTLQEVVLENYIPELGPVGAK